MRKQQTVMITLGQKQQESSPLQTTVLRCSSVKRSQIKYKRIWCKSCQLSSRLCLSASISHFAWHERDRLLRLDFSRSHMVEWALALTCDVLPFNIFNSYPCIFYGSLKSLATHSECLPILFFTVWWLVLSLAGVSNLFSLLWQTRIYLTIFLFVYLISYW